MSNWSKSVQVELPRHNMVIDPRPQNTLLWFHCIYHDNGTTITLTRNDNFYECGPFTSRVYDPATEVVPDFNSTTYDYLGVDGEHAPRETTVLFIDPSAKIIKKEAFCDFKRIEKCFMHDGVYTIEEYAFAGCYNMKVIRLSRKLKWIEYRAFYFRDSLRLSFSHQV